MPQRSVSFEPTAQALTGRCNLSGAATHSSLFQRRTSIAAFRYSAPRMGGTLESIFSSSGNGGAISFSPLPLDSSGIRHNSVRYKQENSRQYDTEAPLQAYSFYQLPAQKDPTPDWPKRCRRCSSSRHPDPRHSRVQSRPAAVVLAELAKSHRSLTKASVRSSCAHGTNHKRASI